MRNRLGEKETDGEDEAERCKGDVMMMKQRKKELLNIMGVEASNQTTHVALSHFLRLFVVELYRTAFPAPPLLPSSPRLLSSLSDVAYRLLFGFSLRLHRHISYKLRANNRLSVEHFCPRT